MGKNCARGLEYSLRITNGFVYATLVIENRLACCLLMICKKSWQQATNSDIRQRKMY